MKWHWGTKIMLVYSGFVLFMLGMVYLCTRQHYDLVAADYYDQEIRYQEVIDGKKNTSLLGRDVVITRSAQEVTVELPVDCETGMVQFYRPSDAARDLTMSLSGTNRVSVPINRLGNGSYQVKARWVHGGRPYYSEQVFIAP